MVRSTLEFGGRPLRLGSVDEQNDVGAVLKEAERVFGDAEKADRWLNRSNLTLDRRAPAELLDTMDGRGLVIERLRQIQHGIFI